MEIAGPIIAGIVLAVIIGLFISAGFLLWGARIAGIENRTFGKAVRTIVVSAIASFVLSVVLSLAPVIGTALGVIAWLLIPVLVMMSIFGTTFGKALGATVLAWVLSLAVAGGVFLLELMVFGSLAGLF